MWGLGRIVLIAAALALAGVALWQYAARWRPSVEKYPVQGVDVSAADGPIAWNEVAASGADFGYAVATRGAAERDPAFETNWRGMAAAGLRRGAIHIYSLCRDARDQANAFNTTVPRDEAMLPVAVDISYDESCTTRPERATLVAAVSDFARLVEGHTGKPLLLRLGADLESDYRLSEALPRNIWSVGNFLRPNYASRPWRMWRASDMRRVGGIAEPANWDVAAP